MDIIKELFDYQRFGRNKKIEALAGETHRKHLSVAVALDDDDLAFVAAAGETPPKTEDAKETGADERSDG